MSWYVGSNPTLSAILGKKSSLTRAFFVSKNLAVFCMCRDRDWPRSLAVPLDGAVCLAQKLLADQPCCSWCAQVLALAWAIAWTGCAQSCPSAWCRRFVLVQNLRYINLAKFVCADLGKGVFKEINFFYQTHWGWVQNGMPFVSRHQTS